MSRFFVNSLHVLYLLAYSVIQHRLQQAPVIQHRLQQPPVIQHRLQQAPVRT